MNTGQKGIFAAGLTAGILLTLAAGGCSGYLPDFKGGRWPSPAPFKGTETSKDSHDSKNAASSTLKTPVMKTLQTLEKKSETKQASNEINDEASEETSPEVIKEANETTEVKAVDSTTTLIVQEPGLSLSLLSLITYGTTEKWREIAEANQIKAPYQLQLGQKITLKKPSDLPQEEFNLRLLDIWRTRLARRDGSEVTRLSAPKAKTEAPKEMSSAATEKDIPAKRSVASASSLTSAPAITKVTPIHFTDFVKKMTRASSGKYYTVRFDSKFKIYNVLPEGDAITCLETAFKDHKEVRILSTRSTHEITYCRIL